MAKKKTVKKPLARVLAVVKKKPTTALAKAAPRKTVEATAIMAAPPAAAMLPPLTDDVDMHTLGLSPLMLTEKQEQILGEPVNPLDVLIKPTGQPYVSHPTYTKWFNRAFGRGGWTLRPVSKPTLAHKTGPDMDAVEEGDVEAAKKPRQHVQQTFLFYAGGQCVAQATGEQEYTPGNAEQTYGDALEACNASALRRIAKRLGIGLELWDKRWLNAWLAEYAVKVRVQGRNKPMWRLKSDPPIEWPKEIGPYGGGDARPSAGSGGQQRGEQKPPASFTSPKGDEPITEDQRRRLFSIAKTHGFPTKDAVLLFLTREFKITSTTDIKRSQYDDVVAAFEAPPKPARQVRTDLPILDADISWGPAPQREPGEDG